MVAIHEIAEFTIWHALFRLEARHWHDVDFNGGRTVHELYLSDGLLSVGANRFEGAEGVKRFYEWRRGRRETVTRHVMSNLIVLDREGPRARMGGLVTVYRARVGMTMGEGNTPALIADLTSDCMRDDGAWRYASHVLDPVFIGNDLPPSLSIDPRFLATPMGEHA